MINEGGVNGLGEGLINTNSAEFKHLKEMIVSTYSDQKASEIIENQFLSIRFSMESYLNSDNDEVINSGEFIKMYLSALDAKATNFADYIGYEKSNLSALMNGRRKINPSLAIKLGRIFKINPVIWLHIEVKNELKREKKANTGDYDNYSLKDFLSKVA